jgi:hypothetical protein
MVGRTKAIDLRQQRAFVQLYYPSWRCTIAAAQLVCTGELQPLPIADTYQVRIVYKLGDSPDITVVDPPLRRRDDGAPIPHLYEHDRLCLYLPGSKEWWPDKYLAITIIPWTTEWLAYYEAWHATGVWLGDQEQPQ